MKNKAFKFNPIYTITKSIMNNILKIEQIS